MPPLIRTPLALLARALAYACGVLLLAVLFPPLYIAVKVLVAFEVRSAVRRGPPRSSNEVPRP